MKYFIVEKEARRISGVTDDPAGFRSTVPITFVETKELEPDNTKILFDGSTYWAEPIDINAVVEEKRSIWSYLWPF